LGCQIPISLLPKKSLALGKKREEVQSADYEYQSMVGIQILYPSIG
jgi:hypothetical protein